MNVDLVRDHRPLAGFATILPFLFFIVLFFGISLVVQDFYAVPVLVAFTLTAAFAFVLYRRRGLEANIQSFCAGAGDFNVVLMVLIFLLAGCFGSLAKSIGAVSSVVDFCLFYTPSSAIVAGLFVMCCFISLAMGSSMGTVIALSPIAVGIAQEAGLALPLVLGAVLGGAMFGDNLSSISDTTIAAVRTQGCELGDKFRQNILIVLPAAVLAVVLYALISVGSTPPETLRLTREAGASAGSFLKMLPYLFVLLGAFLRVNVLALLFMGVVLCAAIGLVDGQFDLVGLFKVIHQGMIDMEDLSVLSLVAAGTSQLIKDNGGLAYILEKVLGLISTRKSAEYGIGLLAAVADLVTANNTIAIVIAGPVARELAVKFEIEGRRSASLLDIFASALQGIIPYGAQVLSAVSFAKISPLELIPFNFYGYLSLAAALAAVHWELPERLIADRFRKGWRRARKGRFPEADLGLPAPLQGRR